jgi:hypothetical protein
MFVCFGGRTQEAECSRGADTQHVEQPHVYAAQPIVTPKARLVSDKNPIKTPGTPESVTDNRSQTHPAHLTSIAEDQAGCQPIVSAKGMNSNAATHVEALQHLEDKVLVEGIQGDLFFEIACKTAAAKHPAHMSGAG